MSRLGLIRALAWGASAVAGCRIEGGFAEKDPPVAAAGTSSETPPAPVDAGEGGNPFEQPETPEAPAEGGAGGMTASTGGEAVGVAGLGGGAVGGAGGESGVQPTECNLNEDCKVDCRQDSRECQLVDLFSYCEFVRFAGETRKLACGELAKVGDINCGACGMVSVQLYFDGRSCWQGLTGCGGDTMNDILFRIIE